MPDVMRVKMRWDGFTGGPGFSVFHFRNLASAGITVEDANTATDRVSDFAAQLVGLLPYQARLTVSQEVESFDVATGQLQTVVNADATPVHHSIAAAGAVYNGAVGASITWRTPQVRNGRRIRGRTFLVPLNSGAFDNGGNLTGAVLGAINVAATGLRDDTGVPDLVVWARPTAPGAADGDLAAINGHSVPIRGAVLRSRRD